eukprot:Blabericola_migrator_1__7483@NODE_381_length_9180_cov_88_545814_g304_i0_p1_GENE_NODE_381_length_9180_cov_88_545814_g304_i0NODE_381_length_9180_cov_88_545814_g304_i0_p1_ORF_typecomplete_len1318_score281_16ABC1/PF03109_16/2_4e32Betalactamase/PF00144_24/3_9e23Betalactamase/PF00144_24/58Betalactamase/PF00144_24/43WaaY/PF06176_11/3_1e14RIO1/PF01163_22/1_1e04RIO1/PF01163_22/5_1e11RIO1/PF01163_22/4_2e03Kdo/PF06293_14/1e06APH/PF01636_23/9_4e05APH/PF01636_23/4_2e03Pkinase_Tyr/PF07714_17/0_16YrbLPhoP_reg/
MEGWNRKVRTLYTWSHLYLGFKVAQVRSRMLPEQQREQYWKERHSQFAHTMWSGIADLRGWWVKVGQFLSTRADLLPTEYVSELEKLQDMMPSSSFEIMKNIVESELGQPLDEVFAEFDERALASASIGQVHKAKLKDGAQVVVKIQHPDVDKLLTQDMKLLGQLSWAFGLLEKGLNFTAVLDEWQKQAALELDFRYEMQNQIRVFKAMERAGIRVIIPRCYPEYTTRKVMVMEFIDGFKVTDKVKLAEYGVDVDKLCCDITRSFAYQIHMDGLFNGDPHPGNIMVKIDEEGKAVPVLIDWGLVKEFTDRERLAFARCIVSVANFDVMGLMEAFQAMGFRFRRKTPMVRRKKKKGKIVEVEETVPIPVDPEIYMDAIGVLFSNNKQQGSEQQKAHLKDKDKKKMWAAAKTKGKADVQNLQESNPLDDWPKDIIFFLRVASLLHGLTVQLQAQVPFFQLLLARAEEAVIKSGVVPPAFAHLVVQSLTQEALATRLSPYQTLGLPTESNPRSLLEWKIQKHLMVASARGDLLGCQVSVWHKRNLIADVAVGRMGPYDARPVSGRTLFTAFSLTNILLITLLLYLVSGGKLKLSDCVSEWWDQFIRNGKRSISIEQILSHQSGVHGFLPSNLSLSQITSYKYMIKLIEDFAPVCRAGMCHHYPFYCCSWVFHEVLFRVTKLKPQKLLKSLCLREWKLTRLAKHIFFPIPQRVLNVFKQLETEENKADLLLKSMAQPCVEHKLIDFSEDPAVLHSMSMKEPKESSNLKVPGTSQPASSNTSRQGDVSSEEGSNSSGAESYEDEEGDQELFGSPERDEVVKCHTPSPTKHRYHDGGKTKFEIVLSDDEVQREINTTAVLDQVPVEAIQHSLKRNGMYADALESWNTGSTELLLNQRFKARMMTSNAEFQNSFSRSEPARSVSGTKSRRGLRALRTMLDNLPDEPQKRQKDSAVELLERLARCRRDLGIARMADDKSMRRAVRNANEPVEDTIEALKEMEALKASAEEKKWLDELEEARTAPHPLHDWDVVQARLSILSKYAGRVPSMREYVKQQEIATSKIAELMDKQTRAPENLTAIQLMRRRPHLMDPLLYDSKEVAPLDIPCANARVTARAMATLIHAVSRGHVMRLSLLKQACIPRTVDFSIEAHIGTGGLPPIFGLGYQLLPYCRRQQTLSASGALALAASPDRLWKSEQLKEPLPSQISFDGLPSYGLCEPNAFAQVVGKIQIPPPPPKPKAVQPRVSINFADPVDDRKRREVTRGFGFGTSDMNGNLAFSFPEEELSICVLVNDTVTGSTLAQEILQIVMESCSLELDNNITQQH